MSLSVVKTEQLNLDFNLTYETILFTENFIFIKNSRNLYIIDE
jgi:hypothetical protein